MATELCFEIEAVGTKFPDCEGKRKLPNGTYEKVEIEFEHKSKNYKNDHPLDWNGILVCWEHNWTRIPNNIEVIELKSVLKEWGKLRHS